MFDINEAEFCKWETESCSYFGMRHKQSNEVHGPVRKIDHDEGTIEEYTAKDGKSHGLFVTWAERKVRAALHSNGLAVGWLQWDTDWNQDDASNENEQVNQAFSINDF